MGRLSSTVQSLVDDQKQSLSILMGIAALNAILQIYGHHPTLWEGL